MRDNEELMNNFRQELRRAVGQRFKRVDLDRFKQELRDHVTHFLFDQTGRSPIVIPVVNVIIGKQNTDKSSKPGAQPSPSQVPNSPEQEAEQMQQRFQQMFVVLIQQRSAAAADRVFPSVFGRLSPAQWREVHLWHCEHHLSFLLPKQA